MEITLVVLTQVSTKDFAEVRFKALGMVGIARFEWTSSEGPRLYPNRASVLWGPCEFALDMENTTCETTPGMAPVFSAIVGFFLPGRRRNTKHCCKADLGFVASKTLII